MVTNSLGTDPALFGKYDAWREGDTKLDWWGPQVGQGTYPGDQGEVLLSTRSSMIYV